MIENPVVATVGAGRMGCGLAHVFAYAGHQIRIIDIKKRDLNSRRKLEGSVFANISNTLGLMETLGKISPDDRANMISKVSFHTVDGAANALAGADVVFEAVPEVADIKRSALTLISQNSPENSIIASTTSTILVDELAQHVLKPHRFLNAHWLNPAFLIPLVELSIGKKTSPQAVENLKGILESIGKVPVVLKASPGFIVPRIQALAMSEAARTLEEGVATADEIDKALRVGFGLRFAILGLIEFIDWGGNDILYHAGTYMKDALQSDRFEVADITKEHMQDGRNGMREGRGFYNYQKIDIKAYQMETLRKLMDLIDHLGLLAPPGGIKNLDQSPASRAEHPYLGPDNS